MKTKPLAALILTIALFAFGIWQMGGHTLTTAPAAVFTTIKGETITLAALKGKPVLVTFWATDCLSCIAEIPQLISLHQQFSPQGLNIIAVAMSYDPPNHVAEMSNAKNLPYAVALDPSAAHAYAFGGVMFTPTSFLIDKNGEIVMRTVGKLDFALVEKQLRKLS